MNSIIEYDGEQHFQPVRFNGMPLKEAKKRFFSLSKRDQIKNKYCQDQNINLIRIPYTEFKNVESILYRKLNLN
jgi:hypothetical protein